MWKTLNSTNSHGQVVERSSKAFNKNFKKMKQYVNEQEEKKYSIQKRKTFWRQSTLDYRHCIILSRQFAWPRSKEYLRLWSLQSLFLPSICFSSTAVSEVVDLAPTGRKKPLVAVRNVNIQRVQNLFDFCEKAKKAALRWVQFNIEMGISVNLFLSYPFKQLHIKE